ncbi:hypothetical protein DITRI_Ditri09bG0159300 [Diplodiscus trichospermus]
MDFTQSAIPKHRLMQSKSSFKLTNIFLLQEFTTFKSNSTYAPTIKDMTKQIGDCSILEADMWGLLLGLEIAWNTGVRRLEVEVDSLCLLQKIEGRDDEANSYTVILASIRQMMQQD